MAKTPEFADPSRQQGISLHELTEAFAQAMGRRTPPPAPAGADPQAEAAPEEEAAPETSDQAAVAEPPVEQEPHEVGHLTAESSEEDRACPISPLSLLEAMLFVGDAQNRPLVPGRAAEPMRGVEPDEIPALVEELNRRYAVRGCPYHIVSEAGGYRMVLSRDYDPLRLKFLGRAREARLSQAAIDVLAIVAYQQPLTADDVSRLRGTPSNPVLSQLVRRQLLRVERVSSTPRVVHYYTTERFLALFGLESLGDIPQSEEIDRR